MSSTRASPMVSCGVAIQLALIAPLLAGCDRHPVQAPQRTIRFTSGTPSGGFHPIGEALAEAFRRLPNMSIEVRQSSGSVANLEAIERNEADVGFASADVAYSAFTRGTDATSVPFEHLRGIAVLHVNPLHLIVSKRSGIRSPADLRSRRVGLGLPGSGTALIASLVMRAFGVDLDMVNVEMLSYAEAAVRVGNDSLDALFVVGSGPSDAVKIATTAGARLLSLQAPELDILRHDYPFLKRVVVPAGMYPFHNQPIRTLGVENILVCSSRLDEVTVYELTKRLFEELPSLVNSQPALRLMDFAQAPSTPIRLHNGAALYYREQELAR